MQRSRPKDTTGEVAIGRVRHDRVRSFPNVEEASYVAISSRRFSFLPNGLRASFLRFNAWCIGECKALLRSLGERREQGYRQWYCN